MTMPLHALIVEDSEDDGRLMVEELQQAGFAVTYERVESLATLQAALQRHWDVLLVDWQLPEFTGWEALRLYLASGQEAPFIVVSGVIGEEVAVDMMKAGARDFVSKDHLTRLAPVVRRELRDAAARRTEQRVAAERKQLLEREQAAIAEAISLKRDALLKDNFINAVSHELRTPLTSIAGYVELLEDDLSGTLSPSQRSYLEEVRRGATRLASLVDDLLDFARMQAGTFSLAMQRDDLNGVMASALRSMAPQLQDKELKVVSNFWPEPVLVPMDAKRIEQVLLNLLSNAIKFTPSGGTITLEIEPSIDDVRLSLRDTGIGIGSEDLSHLFTRFFQVDPSTTREYGGAGLGLAISKAIVEAHGGRLEVKSELGRGSCFWLTLPLHGNLSSKHSTVGP